MIRNSWKGPQCCLRTMQSRISLRIHTGWWASLLPAYKIYKINGYYSICRGTENDQIRYANDIRSFFPRCTWNVVNEYSSIAPEMVPFLCSGPFSMVGGWWGLGNGGAYSITTVHMYFHLSICHGRTSRLSVHAKNGFYSISFKKD